MATLKITGGKRLSGRIAVEGNKNSALPLLAACLLTDQECVLENVPRIRDVEVLADILTVREAIGFDPVLKVIIESAVLSDDAIVEACRAAERAGANFVKTSTGFHPAGGASAHAVRLMAETVTCFSFAETPGPQPMQAPQPGWMTFTPVFSKISA